MRYIEGMKDCLSAASLLKRESPADIQEQACSYRFRDKFYPCIVWIRDRQCPPDTSCCRDFLFGGTIRY